MKISQEIINHRIEYAKQCILMKKQNISLNNQSCLTWPLFFSDGAEHQEESVDVCTSALGVISISKFIGNSTETAIIDAIKKGVATLLFVRNSDGSWPSKISLVSKDTLSMEGVIHDTCYALMALMSVGFLSSKLSINILIDPKTDKPIANFKERLKIIQASLNWLLDNRVSQGWQYTGTRYLESNSLKDTLPAYTMPSANAIITLSEIMKAIKVIQADFFLLPQMQIAIDETVNWFCEISNKDGGFGISRGEKSKIGSTAKVIIALSSVNFSTELNEKVKLVLHKAVKWIISNYKPKKISFEDVSEYFCQLIISVNETTKAYKRSIIHESFVEASVMDALRLYYDRYYSILVINKKQSFFQKTRILITIKKAIQYMLSLQLTEGINQGAVKGRRYAKKELYAMYTCNDYIISLKSLNENAELFPKVRHSTLRYCVLIGAYIILFAVLLLPCFILENPWYLTLELLVLNPLSVNITSSIIDKLFKI